MERLFFIFLIIEKTPKKSQENRNIYCLLFSIRHIKNIELVLGTNSQLVIKRFYLTYPVHEYYMMCCETTSKCRTLKWKKLRIVTFYNRQVHPEFYLETISVNQQNVKIYCFSQDYCKFRIIKGLNNQELTNSLSNKNYMSKQIF